MGYLIIIIVGCAIIWLTYYTSNKKASFNVSDNSNSLEKTETIEERWKRQETERKRREEEERKRREEEERKQREEEEQKRREEEGRKRREAEERENKLKSRKTLDEIYAEENDMWVCEYCETLNPNGVHICVACGIREK